MQTLNRQHKGDEEYFNVSLVRDGGGVVHCLTMAGGQALCREGTASTSFPKKMKVGRKPLTLDWSHSWTWDREEALQSFSHTFVSKFIPTKSIYSQCTVSLHSCQSVNDSQSTTLPFPPVTQVHQLLYSSCESNQVSSQQCERTCPHLSPLLSYPVNPTDSPTTCCLHQTFHCIPR